MGHGPHGSLTMHLPLNNSHSPPPLHPAAGFPAYLPDLPLAVFGTGSAWFNPAAKQGNPVTVIVPGAVKTYSDNKDTSYSKDWSLDNTDGFVVLGGAQ